MGPKPFTHPKNMPDTTRCCAIPTCASYFAHTHKKQNRCEFARGGSPVLLFGASKVRGVPLALLTPTGYKGKNRLFELLKKSH